MLQNIKSVKIMKDLFNPMSFERQLKLVKYSKSMQNKLNISLSLYKIFSKTYIVYESKEKGKEYTTEDDILSFEGEYKNRKRSGKGKEYYENGRIKFEGEYLNGKRNGKGKEYYEYDNLKFDGEYLNDKKWNGKGYDTENNIVYEIKDGKGSIKEYDSFGNLIFEGGYLENAINIMLIIY